MSNTITEEPLLIQTDNRFVMFPIQDDTIWKMYKKQVDCFWRTEEVDLTADMKDWQLLTQDEQYFISMILAFFAASDGIVLENLATRFMKDVQLAEARAFYGFQIAMENIHCVVGETKILTDKGYFMIKDLENKWVNIWNGDEFSNVEIKYTGDQEIYKVNLSNGMELDCSPGHKWLLQQDNPSETTNLKKGDIIEQYVTPVLNFENVDEFLNPYMHGFFCGDGTYTNNYPMIYLYDKKKELLPYFKYDSYQENTKRISFFITNYINKDKFVVPINYSIDVRLRWLEGLLDADGCKNLKSTSIHVSSINFKFLQEVQLLLTTLGIQTNIKLNNDAELQLLPKNNENKEYYMCKKCNILCISGKSVNKLIELGLSPKRLNCKRLIEKIDTKNIKIISIEKISENSATYCFNEPKKHRGIFNGILTCQSETYSLLIETYIKNTEEKTRLFHAIQNFPCIKKKSDWAQKWIETSSIFAERLIAFACIEGIFFSGAFCSIYWLKKRGLMPGLTFSNELISRDEALHTEFAILLYSKLNNKLDESCIYTIIKDAVDIETEFICEALTCKLIGMNSLLMTQYIQFVADRLCLQLGYNKIYNVANPFPWMELISLQSKTNFFEKSVSEYALANKTKDDDIFELDENF